MSYNYYIIRNEKSLAGNSELIYAIEEAEVF